MSILRKLIVVLLVACMAVSLAGCSDTTWIMSANDVVINSGLYIYYQTQGHEAAIMELAAEDINYYYNYMYGVPMLDEMVGEQTVEEYANEFAIDMCKQFIVVEHLFNELGLELDATDEAIIKNQTNSIWTGAQTYYTTIGITESTVRKAVTATIKEEKVFDAYYEVGGIKGTTEDTIKGFLAEDYARIKYMTFTFADSIDDAIDEARKNEQLALAQSYLDRANAGEDFNTLIAEYNEYLESLEPAEEEAEDVIIAEEETEDETAEAEEEVDEYLNETIVHVDGVSPSEKFVGYIFDACKVNECTIIQDDLSFYLVQRLDILERSDIYEENRDFLISQVYDSDYTGLINETLQGYDIVINDKAVKRYTLENAILGPEGEYDAK